MTLESNSNNMEIANLQIRIVTGDNIKDPIKIYFGNFERLLFDNVSPPHGLRDFSWFPWELIRNIINNEIDGRKFSSPSQTGCENNDLIVTTGQLILSKFSNKIPSEINSRWKIIHSKISFFSTQSKLPRLQNATNASKIYSSIYFRQMLPQQWSIYWPSRCVRFPYIQTTAPAIVCASRELQ